MKNKIYFFIFIILIIFSFVFFSNNIKNTFYYAFPPFQNLSWNIGRRFSYLKETVLNSQQLIIENNKLKNRNRDLILENIYLNNLKEENNKLREALGVNLQKEFDLNLVKIFGKDFNQDKVLINKGEKEGIKKGHLLIDEKRVVFGIVDRVYKNFSEISLISQEGKGFNIEVKDKEISAVIRGMGNLNLLMDFIPSDSELEGGDILITSSVGNTFPPGLLIGSGKYF